MNILEVQDKLKDLSDKQLYGRMQTPDGLAPQYLILSEMTRRRDMRREADAPNGQLPEAPLSETIPQELLGSAAQGGGGVPAPTGPGGGQQMQQGLGSVVPQGPQGPVANAGARGFHSGGSIAPHAPHAPAPRPLSPAVRAKVKAQNEAWDLKQKRGAYQSNGMQVPSWLQPQQSAGDNWRRLGIDALKYAKQGVQGVQNFGNGVVEWAENNIGDDGIDNFVRDTKGAVSDVARDAGIAGIDAAKKGVQSIQRGSANKASALRKMLTDSMGKVDYANTGQGKPTTSGGGAAPNFPRERGAGPLTPEEAAHFSGSARPSMDRVNPAPLVDGSWDKWVDSHDWVKRAAGPDTTGYAAAQQRTRDAEAMEGHMRGDPRKFDDRGTSASPASAASPAGQKKTVPLPKNKPAQAADSSHPGGIGDTETGLGAAAKAKARDAIAQMGVDMEQAKADGDVNRYTAIKQKIKDYEAGIGKARKRAGANLMMRAGLGMMGQRGSFGEALRKGVLPAMDANEREMQGIRADERAVMGMETGLAGALTQRDAAKGQAAAAQRKQDEVERSNLVNELQGRERLSIQEMTAGAQKLSAQARMLTAKAAQAGGMSKTDKTAISRIITSAMPIAKQMVVDGLATNVTDAMKKLSLDGIIQYAHHTGKGGGDERPRRAKQE